MADVRRNYRQCNELVMRMIDGCSRAFPGILEETGIGYIFVLGEKTEAVLDGLKDHLSLTGRKICEIELMASRHHHLMVALCFQCPIQAMAGRLGRLITAVIICDIPDSRVLVRHYLNLPLPFI